MKQSRSDLARLQAILVFLLSLLSSQSLIAQTSPAIRQAHFGLLQSAEQLASDRLQRRLLGLTHHLEHPDSSAVLHLLVKSRKGSRQRLEAAGAQVQAQAGDIFSIRLAAADLPGFLTRAPVDAVEPAAVYSLENDRARRETRVETVWQRQRNLTGVAPYRGRGVILGVVDTGIDWRHGDFIEDRSGRSRILYLWDQTLSPSPAERTPPHFDYGVEYDSTNINAALQGQPQAKLRSFDYHGHGTHVAGIAAGDGSATEAPASWPPGTFAGVAPQADLVIVKVGETAYADQILDAVRYVFQRAEALRRPAVVNLSLGSHFGAHDGTSLLEQALDAITGPGRIVVKSAGNDGPSPERPVYIHAETTARPEKPGSLSFIVPAYKPRHGDGNDFLTVVIWYQGEDRLRFEIESPGGRRFAAAPGRAAVAATEEGFLSIANGTFGAELLNGDRQCRIDIADVEGNPPAAGEWRIKVEAVTLRRSGHVDAWIAAAQLAGARASFVQGAEADELVSLPGTARRVITVGAYSTKTVFESKEGGRSQLLQAKVRQRAYFSSFGTRSDVAAGLWPRLKPDICAPGFGVVSALSGESQFVGSSWEHADGRHLMLAGTSMSAPAVAGVIALLLQQNPLRDPENVRWLLQQTAAVDEFTGPVPNAPWGFGKLDAFAALGGNRAPERPPPPRIEFKTGTLSWKSVAVDERGLPEKVVRYELHHLRWPQQPLTPANRIAAVQHTKVKFPADSCFARGETVHFFRLLAVDDFGNRSAPSAVIGESRVQLAAGEERLVPWPVADPRFPTARRLLRAFPQIESIARWDVPGQRWQTLSRAGAAGDFLLLPGSAYRIRARAALELHLQGSPRQNLSIPLFAAERKGNNLILLPLQFVQGMLASELARQIGREVELISIRDEKHKSWRSYVPGLAFTDFPVPAQSPVMIAVSHDTVWLPKVKKPGAPEPSPRKQN